MDNKLYEHPLFTVRHELLSPEDRIRVTYERARLVIQTWDLTPDEIGNCTRRFWLHQQDPMFALDPALANIVTCSINLFIGTLYPLLSKKPYLRPLVEKARKAEILGNLFLSELGHGLDILNLETTATKVSDGFILNTPTESATKFMPPTLPVDGVPRWGIVMAKLIVDGDERGVHPFLVQTSDEFGMCPGVSNTCLPVRSGTMLDYSLTSFDNIRLPSTAFLGHSMDPPKDRRELLHGYISRIPIGTSAIGMPAAVSVKLLATLAADYSLRRHVQGSLATKVPIISFRTQALPVLYTTAIAHVLTAWMAHVVDFYVTERNELGTRITLGTVFKTTSIRMALHCCRNLGERLGAQSLFPQNMLGTMETDLRGISIAEGDILALCIRLFTEILLGRHNDLPIPHQADTLLAKRYTAYVNSNTFLMSSFPAGHRDSRFNDLILPQCEPAVRALGHALAYSAAVDAGVAQPLLDLFEMACIKLDSGWYTEYAGISEAVRMQKEDRAASQALPNLKRYVDELGVRKWLPSPIITDSKWEKWLRDVKLDNRAFAGGLLRRSSRLEGMLARL
ncbi:hypothetical protein BXZ70DRAFT_889443 [Cristinia sonorae]|uniref:Acyl-CoA oxidase n=1 Tax=Cristinia sonorae TaxID=1940300 RepID=A0A8K0XRV9_9AGAR|nr:hypothetical protein BXZ70DRAFT_889443 [Cristinia sonorae]